MIHCFRLQIHHGHFHALRMPIHYLDLNVVNPFLTRHKKVRVDQIMSETLNSRSKVYTRASRECMVEIAEDPKSVCPDEVVESRWRLREGDGSLLDDTNFLVCSALFKKSVASWPISAFFRHSSRTLIRDIQPDLRSLFSLSIINSM